MSTQTLPVWLFLGVAGLLVAIVLVKVGKLVGSPHLPIVAEQDVDLARAGSYALWLTGDWAWLLAELHPVRLADAGTGAPIALRYRRFPVLIRGFGSYRQLATFAIERPGRYILRIMGPAPQSQDAVAAGLILERRWR